MAYAEAGHFEEAVQAAIEAIAAARVSGEQALAQELRRRELF